ncbi:MAG: Gldg family protein [bacterium]
MRLNSIRTLSAGSLLVLAAAFIVIVALSNTLFRGARIDLTENNAWTLSKGTHNILKSIDEPIHLYFFYSDKQAKDLPSVRLYANRVKDMLMEYQSIAGGKLQLDFIDPEPFSEQEDQATQFGLQSVPIGRTGESLYFGLAGSNSLDGQATIPFFDPSKEAFLEYDLSKMIYSLISPKKPVIGLMSDLKINGGFDQQTRQAIEPWAIYTQIDQLFDIRNIDTSSQSIAEDIDVLLLIHPKSLSEQTQYAIDQFVLKGGRLIVFVDPMAEKDETGADPNNPTAAMMAAKDSNLDTLFKKWGVEYQPSKFVADGDFGLQIRTSQRGPVTTHLGILGIDKKGLAQKQVITGGLDKINLSSAGAISLTDESPLSLTALIQSSPNAMLMDTQKLRFLRDPSSLYRDFVPVDQPYTIAGMLSGQPETAFKDGVNGKKIDNHLDKATKDINVLIVADTDILSDRLWVQTQRFLGQTIMNAWASNGDFLYNALDVMTGNPDLISIRGRTSSQRPFTRVEKLRNQAEAQLHQTELKLQDQLSETERKLSQLQTSKDDKSNVILSSEQQAELQRFVDEKLRIRKELRKVRHDLDSDIESLGTRMRLINIGLVPTLLTLIVLFVLYNKRRKS